MIIERKTLFFKSVMLISLSCHHSKTWTDARDTCRSFTANSDLVSIHSVAENEFVASLFSGLLYAAWIGLSDRGVLYGRFSILTFQAIVFFNIGLKNAVFKTGAVYFLSGIWPQYLSFDWFPHTRINHSLS